MSYIKFLPLGAKKNILSACPNDVHACWFAYGESELRSQVSLRKHVNARSEQAVWLWIDVVAVERVRHWVFVSTGGSWHLIFTELTRTVISWPGAGVCFFSMFDFSKCRYQNTQKKWRHLENKFACNTLELLSFARPALLFLEHILNTNKLIFLLCFASVFVSQEIARQTKSNINSVKLKNTESPNKNGYSLKTFTL